MKSLKMAKEEIWKGREKWRGTVEKTQRRRRKEKASDPCSHSVPVCAACVNTALFVLNGLIVSTAPLGVSD